MVVGIQIFDLVNRETGRGHTLFFTSGGLSAGLPAGGGEPDYTLFTTSQEVTFDDFDFSGAVCSSVSVGLFKGYSYLEITICRGPFSWANVLATVTLKGWGYMVGPGATVAAHGVLTVSYGAGKPVGPVPRLSPNLEGPTRPDKRLARTRAKPNEPPLVISGDTLFDFDSATLRRDAAAVLQKVATRLNRSRSRVVTIVGHTDAVGKDWYNLDLSLRRALAVKTWMQARNVAGANLFLVRGDGKSKPRAPNSLPNGKDNPAGRQQNRRVEFEFSD
jgi:outer membrane protein OmpA-like peptidoglycan-associated protein